jgi:Kdo2-lipid IVA lauroyltransferase/acyltransferase
MLMAKFTCYIFRFFIFIFRFIPFSLLFGFADLVFYVIYYLVGYRKQVVFRNLRNSFPEKSNDEINSIAKGFYHHLSDMLIESLKAFTMTEDAVVKRYKYNNTEFLDELFKQGKSVICIAGHYGNWEWGGLASGVQLKHKPVGFYKPLTNKNIDA